MNHSVTSVESRKKMHTSFEVGNEKDKTGNGAVGVSLLSFRLSSEESRLVSIRFSHNGLDLQESWK